LISNVHLRISYILQDKDFDKVLSLIQNFKRKDFFHEKNRPYSITYKISYTLSSTHYTNYFTNNEYIDLSKLFNDIGRIYLPEVTLKYKMNLN
jgi:hypothetical protein